MSTSWVLVPASDPMNGKGFPEARFSTSVLGMDAGSVAAVWRGVCSKPESLSLLPGGWLRRVATGSPPFATLLRDLVLVEMRPSSENPRSGVSLLVLASVIDLVWDSCRVAAIDAIAGLAPSVPVRSPSLS